MKTTEVGSAVRKLRQSMNVGLRELARKTGLSPAALSAIEKGSCSPTLASLNKILIELGTDLGSFFMNGRQTSFLPVFRSQEMKELSSENRTYLYLTSKTPETKFRLLQEVISPAEKESEWESHDVDISGYIISGGPAKLEIEKQGEWVLRKGDAFYILAKLKHRLTNIGTVDLRQITVMQIINK